MRINTLLCILTCLVFSAAKANNGFEIKTVVIDAGHGGKDPGAIGPGKTYEKNVALAVALKLGEYIKKSYPEVNVVYTRKTDVFLELHERAEIANKQKADLFIAIHCNSSTNSAVYGSSSYVLGLHRTEANLEVAKRENAVILLEEDRDKNYEFDPNTAEGHIIMSMKQNAFLEQSIAFASKNEVYLESYGKRKTLGVKQAGFYVLYKTAMPSILAEIGFISNPDEEKFLDSPKGQEIIASSLFKAFSEYKVDMEDSPAEEFVREQEKEKETVKEEPVKPIEKKPEPVVEKKPEPKPQPVAEKKPEPVAEKKPEPVVEKKPEPVVVKEEPKEDPNYITLANGKKIRRPVENVSGGGKGPEKPAIVAEPTPKPVEKKPEPVVEKKPEPVVEKKPEPVAEKPASKPATETKPTTQPVKIETEPATSVSGNVFKVQLCALKGDLKDRDKVAKLLKGVSTEELPNGLIRYYGGNTSSYATAQSILETAKANGFPTAFIVGFKNGARMTADEFKAAAK